MPYWEWDRCKGAGEREQYLKRKLADCGPSAAQVNRCREQILERTYSFFSLEDKRFYETPFLRMLSSLSLSLSLSLNTRTF